MCTYSFHQSGSGSPDLNIHLSLESPLKTRMFGTLVKLSVSRKYFLLTILGLKLVTIYCDTNWHKKQQTLL